MDAEALRDDRGTTLVELLVTVVILGLALVALLGGLGTAVIVSDQHRQQAVAGAAVRSYAEAVGAAAYVNCATSAQLANPTGYASPAGYTSTVTRVQYWNPNTRQFVNTCASPDPGAQKVSLRVTSNRGQATETLEIIVRKAGV